MPKMKGFLICPVRGHAMYETAHIVEEYESQGWDIHWPPRDTNQEDPTGLQICKDNLAAIRDADTIFVIWDGKSQGCLFDLGMAFALGKSISLISVPPPTAEKSFQNMLVEYVCEK